MAIKFDPIGAEGKRDLVVSLAGLLETGETLSSVLLNSVNPSVLAITAALINASPISQDGVTAAIGEAVTFSVEGLVPGTEWDGGIDIWFQGTDGTEDTLRVIQPIVEVLTE